MSNDTGLTNTKQWTANQRKFMEWLALPSVDRNPLTQRALAQVLGVHEITLSGWRKLPGFMAEVHKLITASLGDDYFDVMYSFKQEAKKGSFPHQRMFMEMMGAYVEKHEVKGSLIVEGGLSDDELIARADAVIAKRTPHTP